MTVLLRSPSGSFLSLSFKHFQRKRIAKLPLGQLKPLSLETAWLILLDQNVTGVWASSLIVELGCKDRLCLGVGFWSSTVADVGFSQGGFNRT